MDSIVDILSQGRDREAQASRIHGFVVGLVTNNKDPDKLGRIKVKFPWLSDEVESWWARICQPMGGLNRGHWWIPEIDDEVLVGFEHGDVRFPYILGSLYNGVDTPPVANDTTSAFAGEGYDHGGHDVTDHNEDGKNDIRFIKSRSGHLLLFDDKDGAERIVVSDHTGKHRIEVHTADKRVVITSEDGDIELIAKETILLRCNNLITETRTDTDMTADGEFKAHSAGKMSHTTDADMLRDAGGKIDETAGGNTTIEAGQNVTIKAGMNFKAEGGMNAEMKGSIDAKVDGGATATIKGGMVNIN